MTELGTFLLPVLPLLALLAFLLLGRYPGCEAVVRLAELISARPGRGAAPSSAPPPLRPPSSFAPAGGLLIALGLAQRPPPAVARFQLGKARLAVALSALSA